MNSPKEEYFEEYETKIKTEFIKAEQLDEEKVNIFCQLYDIQHFLDFIEGGLIREGLKKKSDSYHFGVRPPTKKR